MSHGDGTIVRLFPPGVNTAVTSNAIRTYTTANTGAPQVAEDLANATRSGWVITRNGSQLTFTTTANGPVDGQWALTIDNQNSETPGSLAYVLDADHSRCS